MLEVHVRKSILSGLRRHRVRAVAAGAILFVAHAQNAGAAVTAVSDTGPGNPAGSATAPSSTGPVTVEFDRALMFGGSRDQGSDLKQFANGNPLLPGTFRSDVSLNNRELGRIDVTIVKRNKLLGPCFDRDLIARLGLDLLKAPSNVQALMGLGKTKTALPLGGPGEQCLDISDLAEGATAAYSSSQQKLDISIPQASLARTARDAVSPDLWDNGINAGFVNYNFNAFRASAGGVSSIQQYLGLNTGLNLGGWYLRHDGALSMGAASNRRYQSVNTYVRHDVSALKAAVTIGDGYTDGQLFDSIGFRGAMLASDERMLPASQRGYAPVIRGQARGNAKVTVSQNGVTLSETTVPPGPFVIDDLYPTGFGGDLLTTVTEADGSIRSFSTPFSSAPQLLREGGIRYQLVGGSVRSIGLQSSRLIVGTLQYGVNNIITANVGVTATPEYKAVLVGSALNTPIGAASLDFTSSRFVEPDFGTHTGSSVRAGFSTLIPVTLTNFTLVTNRYLSRDSYTLRDALTTLKTTANGLSPTDIGFQNGSPFRPRDRSLISVSQALNSTSSMFLSASSQRSWTASGRQTSFQIGYSHSLGQAQLQVTASRQMINAKIENQITVGVSFPLGGGVNTPNLSLNALHDSASATTSQANISGAYGDEQQYSYSANASRSPTATTGGLSGNWRSSVGTFGASATVGSGTNQASLSGNGGILQHSGGVIFSPTLGQTMALVEAQDAIGAKVAGGLGAKVNGSGFAVAPFLSPYQLNDVALDLAALPADVQLTSTSRQTVPRAGAIVGIRFSGQSGRWLLIKASQPGGRSLPFGANVFDAKDRSVGAVGQASRIDARVANDTGTLRVQWGNGPAEQCWLDYQAPLKVAGVALTTLQGLICQPVVQGPVRTGASPAKDLAPVPQPNADRPAMRVVVTAQLEDGAPVPFGANVTSAASTGGATAVVAGGGRFVMSAALQGVPLAVRWGETGESGCVIAQIDQAVAEGPPGAMRTEAVCRRD